jgi:uncharacterized membrane protein
MTGTISGWVIELFWRRFFGLARRWINPGFLNGPWLPLYGFGTIILYFISGIQVSISIKSLIFFSGLTVLEYITGAFFVNIYNIKLWDYSNNRWNIQGIICPFYSILWTLLGLFFYYIMYPQLKGDINQLLTHLELSFFIGIYAGIFTMDLFHSFNLAKQIKTVIKETNDKWQVDYEKFKLEIRDRLKTIQSNEAKLKNRLLKPHFLLPFQGESIISISEGLNTHKANLKVKTKTLFKKKKS